MLTRHFCNLIWFTNKIWDMPLCSHSVHTVYISFIWFIYCLLQHIFICLHGSACGISLCFFLFLFIIIAWIAADMNNKSALCHCPFPVWLTLVDCGCHCVVIASSLLRAALFKQMLVKACNSWAMDSHLLLKMSFVSKTIA